MEAAYGAPVTPPLLFDLRGKRVYVAGHNGMVGSAIMRRLANEGCEILAADRRTLDLTNQKSTEDWLAQMRPDAVFLAAGLVGGIYANNTYPADFIAKNLAIALNVIRGAHAFGVKKLLALGSSCIYPKFAPQPMTEDALLTGPLEPTNEWYAVAKIAAIKLCEAYRKQHNCDFISVMPTNLYGPNDNYHPQNSHVPAALIRRFHEAKCNNTPTEIVWGTGSPRREFLAADDAADACVFVMKHYSDFGFLNIGTGKTSRLETLLVMSPKPWATRVRLFSTLHALMVHRKNFSTSLKSKGSAGRQKLDYVKAWLKLMRIFLPPVCVTPPKSGSQKVFH